MSHAVLTMAIGARVREEAVVIGIPAGRKNQDRDVFMELKNDCRYNMSCGRSRRFRQAVSKTTVTRPVTVNATLVGSGVATAP
jgi:hypothetical protein